jgi:hypothetical protein
MLILNVTVYQWETIRYRHMKIAITSNQPNQLEVVDHLLLRRLQRERLKILSEIDELANSEGIGRFSSILRRVAALDRYEGHIFAERRLRARKLGSEPILENCKTNPIGDLILDP